MPYAPGTNTGHGHVWERPDGVKARCGGPRICKECARDYAQRMRQAFVSYDELVPLIAKYDSAQEVAAAIMMLLHDRGFNVAKPGESEDDARKNRPMA
jgi:hypothetical protein